MEGIKVLRILGRVLFVTLVVVAGHIEAVSGVWSEWCPKICSCYNMFTTVDCSSRRVSSVPLLPNTTTRLYLENNRIEHLFPRSFERATQLLVLNLHANKLTVVDTAAFAGLDHLQDLNLSLNELIVLRSSTNNKTCLPHLRDLDLSRNHLQNMPRNLAQFTPNLRVLNLAYNEIKSVWLDISYANLTSLHHLDLTGNPIHVIGEFHLNAFRDGSLQVLRMANCELVQIDQLAFSGFENLTSLSLSMNTGIRLHTLTLALGGFSNSSVLGFLDLSSMKLGNLTRDLFLSFPQLTILDLSNNTLYSLDASIFFVLPLLNTLDIQENFLTTIDTSTSLRSLKRLNLRKNWLRHIRVDDLISIEFLDLSQNFLDEVPDNWISRSDTLKFLNLAHNKIRRVSEHAFQKVTLSYLDLSHNLLTSFHSLGMVKIGTFVLSHNSVREIASNAFDHMETVLEQLDLSYNQLSNLPNYTFPSFPALQHINFAHNRLSRWLLHPPMTNIFASFGHLQVLDLSMNNISRLPSRVLEHLHHLTTLHLEGNRIQDLNHVPISDMMSLAKLDLSNNSLRHVDVSVLMGMQYLEQIDLSYNPFYCSCRLLPFLQWLNTTQVTVVDLGDHFHYRCAKPSVHSGMYLPIYLPNKSDCEARQHDIARDLTFFGITVTAVVGLTLLTAFIIYYGKVCHRLKTLHYRWQIRYREVSGMEMPDPMADPKV